MPKACAELLDEYPSALGWILPPSPPSGLIGKEARRNPPMEAFVTAAE
ncbi:hypothetical protein [Desulfosporosinus hippei]|nr:hypothetical protein [Desulfosporosinus hippei]